MVTWPEELPRRPVEGSWTISLLDPAVRNQPELGPPMVRKRYSVETEVWQGTYILTKAQWEKLRSFWKTDVGFGGATFEMFHWINLEDQVTVMFAAAPGPVEHIARGFYRVQCSFTRMPS